jgi:hypothetical protein
MPVQYGNITRCIIVRGLAANSSHWKYSIFQHMQASIFHKSIKRLAPSAKAGKIQFANKFCMTNASDWSEAYQITTRMVTSNSSLFHASAIIPATGLADTMATVECHARLLPQGFCESYRAMNQP